MIKHKYLTLLYRNNIKLGLELDETFKVIRRAILKDLTTVFKKIKLKRQGLRILTLSNSRKQILGGYPISKS